jgi:hypothetical protein
LIEVEEPEPRAINVAYDTRTATVKPGPVRVSLEQQRRFTGDEPHPWVPYGPKQTILVGRNTVGVVAAMGYLRLSTTIHPETPNSLPSPASRPA